MTKPKNAVNFNNNEYEDVKEFSEKVKSTSSSELREKEYGERNSLLTDLYENKQIITIYRIVIIIVLYVFLNNVVYDYLYNEQGQSLFEFIMLGFSNFHYAILVWIGMVLSSFIPYYGLVLWSIITMKLPPKSLSKKILNITALLLAILHHLLFLTVVPIGIKYYEISIPAALALLCDASRMSMKTYAVIRSNSSRVLKYKPHVEDHETLYPTVKQFLYFSFSPATVYKDNYPRNKAINWGNVFISTAEFIGGVFLISLVIKLLFVNAYYDYGTRQFELKEVIMILFKNYIGGLIIIFDLFYVLLHAWLNLFAELLRFSDRMFYKDWWTSENYERYHRTWNVPVHDWLYTYIYKDFHENVLPKNKLIPKILVFFVSAAFHEYVLAFSFGFFLPTLFMFSFVMNVPLTLFKFKSGTFGNLFVLGTVGLGTAFNMCAFTMEFFCRINSPPESITWSYLFTPQLFNCIK